MSWTCESSFAVPMLSPYSPCVRLSAETAGRRVEYALTDQPIAIIGSRRDCHLPLEDSDVSRVHCAVINTGSDVLVTDLRSITGTFRNNERIHVRRLYDGDRLRVGNVDISIEIAQKADGRDRRRTEPAPQRLLRLAGSGRDFELERGVALIGRRGNCEVPLESPDVSRIHALLFEYEHRPVVCDLGSRGGTFVNDSPVSLAWLNNGDALGIGDELLAVTVGRTGEQENDEERVERHGRAQHADLERDQPRGH